MIIKYKELKNIEGNKVVYTGGCFDILHRGHVEYLKIIKELFPKYKLLVGVVPDKRVYVLKGEGRPINKQSHRIAVIDSIKGVDYAVIEPLTDNGRLGATKKMMNALRPRYAVFTRKHIISYQNEFKEKGTEILILNRNKPYFNSTSSIIKKIRKEN